MRNTGKVGKEWLRTRREWLKNNPPGHEGYYICAICRRWIPEKEVEVDHILSRTRAPHLRAEQSNLQPLCHGCNNRKGST